MTDTSNSSAGTGRHARSSVWRVIRNMLGYMVGAACLWWLFRDLPAGRLVHTIAHIHWWRLALCVALALAVYLCVAWEWRLLLRPVGSIRYRLAAQAVFAGRFATDVLPMHVGSLVRAFLTARWMRVALTATLPSLIMERVFDGLWLAVIFGLVSFNARLPPGLVHARNVLLGSVLGGLGIAAVAVLVGRRLPRSGSSRGAEAPAVTQAPVRGPLTRLVRLVELVLGFVGRMTDGMRNIIRSKLLAAVLTLALLKLVIQGLAFLALLWAFGIRLSLGSQLEVFLAGYLGMCIPSTPAGTGLFQLFVVAALGALGVPKPVAAGFSLVSFAVLTIPPALTGFFALAHTGLTLRQIRRGGQQDSSFG
jgi:glycosyltransferase 2 family protein